LVPHELLLQSMDLLGLPSVFLLVLRHELLLVY
jgi:hypothetical protein